MLQKCGVLNSSYSYYYFIIALFCYTLSHALLFMRFKIKKDCYLARATAPGCIYNNKLTVAMTINQKYTTVITINNVFIK